MSRALHRLVDTLGELRDRNTRASTELFSTEIATGLDLASVILPDPHKTAPRSELQLLVGRAEPWGHCPALPCSR